MVDRRPTKLQKRRHERKGWAPPKKTRSAANGVSVKHLWFRRYMHELGFEWIATMKIGTGCKVHLADGELPMGRLIVSLSNHYTAVIDGVIHDTHDPQRSASWVFEPDTGQELKANQGRNHNGVWTEIGSRCVYGYWGSVRIATLPQVRIAGHFSAHGMPNGTGAISSACGPPW